MALNSSLESYNIRFKNNYAKQSKFSLYSERRTPAMWEQFRIILTIGLLTTRQVPLYTCAGMHAFMHACVHACTHARVSWCLCICGMCVCMRVHGCILVHTHIHVCVFIVYFCTSVNHEPKAIII